MTKSARLRESSSEVGKEKRMGSAGFWDGALASIGGMFAVAG